MILGGEAIRELLKSGQLFVKDTCVKSSIKEASYALRIDDDGMLMDGRFYEPGDHYGGQYIEIEPGKIAILSTMERIIMPSYLVGRIGIRLKYALQGLTGLMGIQVDPLYGSERGGERLYVRVANFGNEPIRLMPGDEVFTFELQQVYKAKEVPHKSPTWERIKDALRHQSDLSWSYATRVQANIDKTEKNLRNEVDAARAEITGYLQPLVMFGIFLLAVTILGVSLSVILSLRDTPETLVPMWITEWGWIFLLITLSIATFATAAMGLAAAVLGISTACKIWTKE